MTSLQAGANRVPPPPTDTLEELVCAMEAELFDEMWQVEQSHWWFVARRRIVESLVERYSPDNTDRPMRLRELGCGTGGNLAHWNKRHEVFGMDNSRRALEYASKRVGARVELGALPDDVPFEPSSFDVVLMTDVLEHIEDDVNSVQVAMSLLQKNGIFVATVPAHQWLYSPRDAHHQHFRRYAKKDFTRLFQFPGVEVEYLGFYNSLLFPPAAIVRMASKLFGRDAQPGDLQVPFGLLNKTLTGIFSLERKLLGRVPLPTGLSLITVVRRTGEVSACRAQAAA